jgi:hypothetical protein
MEWYGAMVSCDSGILSWLRDRSSASCIGLHLRPYRGVFPMCEARTCIVGAETVTWVEWSLPRSVVMLTRWLLLYFHNSRVPAYKQPCSNNRPQVSARRSRVMRDRQGVLCSTITLCVLAQRLPTSTAHRSGPPAFSQPLPSLAS